MGKVRYGLKNVHYSIYDEKTSKYGPWKAIPGAVTLTSDAQTDQSKFYADNMAYYVTNTNNGETGTFTCAALTDEMLIDLFGYAKDTTSGLIYESMEQKTISVALGYEISGNEEKQRGVRYNITFSLPSQNSNTQSDSSDPDTVELNYTAIGRDFTIGSETVNVLKAHCDNSGDSHATFDKFFDSVVTPGTAVAA